jgi:putative methionine-R-sulfoxide reductase with GAF domain
MEDVTRHPLLGAIEGLLGGEGTDPLRTALDRVLGHFDCSVGTVHLLDPGSGMLQLRAQRGLPEALLPRVGRIPIGKGMAGLAAERRRPVQVCNLQSDVSGVAQPGARAAPVEGSIAVPMLASGSVRGVLGVAKPNAHEFGEAETALLQEVANLLGRSLPGP